MKKYLLSALHPFLFMILGVHFTSVINAQENYSFQQASWLPSNSIVNRIIKTPKIGIAVLTNNGVYIKDKDNNVTQNLKSLNLTNFEELDNDQYVLSSESMIYDKTGKSIVVLDSSQIVTALYNQGSLLWIGTKKGLFRYNLATSKIEEMTKRNSKFDKSGVNFIHRDAANNLWIGTTNGDYRITKNNWKKYNEGKNVLDFFENNEGMWFVSTDDMWLVDLKNRFYPVGLGDDLTKGSLNDFTINTKGKLYFASEKLTAYDPYSSKIQNFEDEITFLTKKTTSLKWDDKSLLLGTEGYGLYELTFLPDSKDLSINILVKKTPSCIDKSDGELEAFVKGGTPPYRYKWAEYPTDKAILTQVKAGLINIEVTDALGLKASKNIEINIPTPSEIEILSIIKPEKGRDNGSITLKSTPIYTYLWANNQQGPKASNLSAGKYAVSITDPNKCTFVQIIDLVESIEKTETITEKVTLDKSQEFVATKPNLNAKELVKGKTIILDQVKFLADSTEVTLESLPTLKELFEILNANPKLKIEIGGHTNTIPPHSYCDQLSNDRAKNIAEYFYLREIEKDRITYKGYGKRKPLTSSTTEAGRQLNQRVEIRVLEN